MGNEGLNMVGRLPRYVQAKRVKGKLYIYFRRGNIYRRIDARPASARHSKSVDPSVACLPLFQPVSARPSRGDRADFRHRIDREQGSARVVTVIVSPPSPRTNRHARATSGSGTAGEMGWTRLGSNQRPNDYESSALTD